MAHLAKNSKSNWKIVFPLIPGTNSLGDISPLSINIFNTVIPSIELESITMPWMGGEVYMEGGGIQYGDWNVSFYVDSNMENYNLIYDWMMYTYDGISRFGREFNDYQISADLILSDNFNNQTAAYTFTRIWPTGLGEIDLNYQDGAEKMECSILFRYDFFKRI